jgi:hypothetical protein
MAYVYRHIRVDKNEPFYIGIGKEEKRCYQNVKRNSIWKAIVTKTNYTVEILFDNLTWEDACIKEKEFILLYGRKDLGTGSLCNLTDGGEGVIGSIRSEEYREKLRKVNTGKKMSKESIEKLKDSLKGRKHSEETKAKMSKTRLGKKLSNLHIESIAKGLKGKKKSDTHVAKMRQTKLGLPIVQINKELKRTIWDSASEASRVTKIAKASILACLNNKRNTAGGSTWIRQSCN